MSEHTFTVNYEGINKMPLTITVTDKCTAICQKYVPEIDPRPVFVEGQVVKRRKPHPGLSLHGIVVRVDADQRVHVRHYNKSGVESIWGVNPVDSLEVVHDPRDEEDVHE